MQYSAFYLIARLLHFNIRPGGAKFLKIFEILTSFRSNFAYFFITLK